MKTFPDEASRSTPTRTFGLSCAKAGECIAVASVAAAAKPTTRRVKFIGSARKSAHLFDQIRLALKADTRQLGHSDIAVLDPHAIGKTAIGLEEIGIRLVAPEPEASGNVERHLMTAMRDAAA